MDGLPDELYVAILSHVDEFDIVALQMTSRRFRTLIESNGPWIWRSCLRRRCERDGLFAPSYKDLVTAEELKRACTSAIRLPRTIDDCNAQGLALSQTPGFRRGTAKFPGPPSPPSGYIANVEGDVWDWIYLVPGGRYLITAAPNWLCMWDLEGVLSGREGEAGETGATSGPANVLQHRFNAAPTGVLRAKCISAGEIRILAKQRKSFTGSGSEVTTCVIFAISSTDPFSASFSIKEVATFPLVITGSPRALILGQVYEDHALILIRCGTFIFHTIIWNTKLNTIGQIRFESNEVGVWRKVRLSDTHFLWATRQHFHAITLPPFEPMREGQMVVVREEDESLLATPEHTIRCVAFAGRVPNPRDIRLVSNTEPAFYLTVNHPNVSTLHVKQHKLLYNPDDLSGTQLSLMDEGTCEDPDLLEMGILCRSSEPCGKERFVLIWEGDEGGLLLSVTARRNRDFDPKADSHINYSLNPVPLEEGYYINPQDVDFLPGVLHDSCCNSGRIVTYRFDRGRSEGCIELYHIN